MLDGRGTPGFRQIGCQVFWINDQVRMGHLDRHESLQVVVVAQIGCSKAVIRKHFFNSIATNLLRQFAGRRCDWIAWKVHGVRALSRGSLLVGRTRQSILKREFEIGKCSEEIRHLTGDRAIESLKTIAREQA